MVKENDNSSFNTGTGSLKFWSGSAIMIAGEECWQVPDMGIYDSQGKYLGETAEEAEVTINKRNQEEDK